MQLKLRADRLADSKESRDSQEDRRVTVGSRRRDNTEHVAQQLKRLRLNDIEDGVDGGEGSD